MYKLFFFFMLIYGSCSAEKLFSGPCDTIVLTNGEMMLCKVKLVTSETIEYYKCGYVSGSNEIRKKKVLVIKYANGTSEKYEDGVRQESTTTKKETDAGTDIPRSFFNIGLGVGPNYGLIGVKTVIGYKDNGLMVGYGMFGGKICYEVGLQGSYKWWFINCSYGAYKLVTNVSTKESEMAFGLIVITGGKIDLIKSKRLFLDAGAGYAGGAVLYFKNGPSIPIKGFTFSAGLNYRIGGE